MLKIHPITHQVGEAIPYIFVAHDCRPASLIVLIDSDLAANILFGDTQLFFHLQLYG